MKSGVAKSGTTKDDLVILVTYISLSSVKRDIYVYLLVSENCCGKATDWSVIMMVYFENPENEDILISWNGSVTFHVLVKDEMEGGTIPTDVFTVYGDYMGNACTMEQAYEQAQKHFKEMNGFCASCEEAKEDCTCTP